MGDPDHYTLSESQTFKNFLVNQTGFKSDSFVEIGKISGVGGFSKLTKGLGNMFSTKVREPEFNDIVNYVDLYKDRISFTARVTNRIVSETVDAGVTAKEICLKFKQWGDFEDEFGIKNDDSEESFDPVLKNQKSSLSDMLSSFCAATEKLSDLHTPLETFFKTQMQPYLEFQERFCEEVNSALKNRDQSQFDLEKCKDNSHSKQLEQQMNNSSYGYNHQDSMSKAKMEHDIKTLQDKEKELEIGKLMADKIVKEEMQAWNDRKDAKLKALFKEMATENLGLIKKQLDVYEGLLEEFEAC